MYGISSKDIKHHIQLPMILSYVVIMKHLCIQLFMWNSWKRQDPRSQHHTRCYGTIEHNGNKKADPFLMFQHEEGTCFFNQHYQYQDCLNFTTICLFFLSGVVIILSCILSFIYHPYIMCHIKSKETNQYNMHKVAIVFYSKSFSQSLYQGVMVL